MIKNNFLKIVAIISFAILAFGCQSLNSKFGNDRTEYANAKELPPIKMPASALAMSTRYDIPEVHGNQNQIITDTLPPNF